LRIADTRLHSRLLHRHQGDGRAPGGRWLDLSALGLSGLCLVHCLAATLLIALVSGAGVLLDHHIHAVGLALALPLALAGFWRGIRQHRRTSLLVPAVLGIGTMSAALMAGHGSGVELGLTVTGVLLLALAHGLNLRWSVEALRR
jgi:uncharacterized membrane protein